MEVIRQMSVLLPGLLPPGPLRHPDLGPLVPGAHLLPDVPVHVSPGLRPLALLAPGHITTQEARLLAPGQEMSVMRADEMLAPGEPTSD